MGWMCSRNDCFKFAGCLRLSLIWPHILHRSSSAENTLLCSFLVHWLWVIIELAKIKNQTFLLILILLFSGGRLYRLYLESTRKQMLDPPLDLLDLNFKLHSD